MLWQSFFIDVALKSFVVMAFITISVGVVRHSSAAIKHRIWTLGIVGVLLVPLLSVLLPSYRLAILPADVAAEEKSAQPPSIAPTNPPTSVSYENVASSLPTTSAGPLVAESDLVNFNDANAGVEIAGIASVDPFAASTVVGVMQNNVAAPIARSSFIGWFTSLMVVWAVGTIALLIPWLIRSLRTRRWIANGMPVQQGEVKPLHDQVCRSIGRGRSVRLLECPELAMPCAAGWFRPVVMLPSAAMCWPTDRLRPVLLHEMAHVIRRDMLIQSLAEIARAAYWFNPLVWLSVSRLPFEREQACDDLVLASGVAASDYAQVLLDVAKDFRRSQAGIGLAMARPEDLPRRLKSMLDKTRSHIPLSRSTAILMLIAMLLVSGSTSALRLVARAQDATEDAPSNNGSADWMEGTGETLQIRLRGTVVNAAGEPAVDPDIKFTLPLGNNNETIIQPTVRGNQFEAWVPVSGLDWNGMELLCQQGDELASMFFQRNLLRQLAVEPMLIRLQKSDRSVAVHVTYENKPVADAKVKVPLVGNRVALGTTDDQGILDIDLYPNEQLSTFTAWTDDATNGVMIGGFHFAHQPVRDRDAMTQTIEMHRCREQIVRMVDIDGKPIEGVGFQMQIATPPPYYNYLGIVDDANLKTDARGEAIVRWYPDWPEVHRYAEIIGDDWFVFKKAKPVEDALVVTLKPRVSRKRVMGQLLSGDLDVHSSRLAGVSVYASSFEAEREDEFDPRYAFTDQAGQFWIDALPGSTYSVHVTDPEVVSDYADVVLFDPETNQSNSPTLKLQQGLLATVKLTAGQEQSPIVNQYVQFRSSHRFTWKKDGEERSGTGGRAITATTDADGVATAIFPPGLLKVSVYQPEWQSSKSIELSDGGENLVTLHQEIDEAREVTGRVVMANGESGNSLVQAGTCELTIGALDGKTRDEREVKTNADGTFAFNTIATKLGVSAVTADHAYAGNAISNSLAEPIEIVLHRTESFSAKLVDSDGNPVVGRQVTASVRMKDMRDAKKVTAEGFIAFSPSFLAFKQLGQTNQQGEVTLSGLPTRLPVFFFAEGQDWQIDEAFLEPGESRPQALWKLNGPSANSSSTVKSSAQRWSDTTPQLQAWWLPRTSA